MNRIGCRIKCGLGLLAFVLLASSLGAAPVPDAMSVPKPGAVRPEGWLRDWALAAAKGYTGHMDEVDGATSTGVRASAAAASTSAAANTFPRDLEFSSGDWRWA